MSRIYTFVAFSLLLLKCLPAVEYSQLVLDSERGRIYGLTYNPYELEAVVSFDLDTCEEITTVQVSRNASDLIYDSTLGDIMVLGPVGGMVDVIDADSFSLDETLTLSLFDTTYIDRQDFGCRIESNGNILYYVDGDYSRVLRVFDRSTSSVLQTFGFSRSSNDYLVHIDFGDIILNTDRTRLFVRTSSTSLIAYDIDEDGTLTQADETSGTVTWDNSRYPWSTPNFLSSDERRVFANNACYNANDLSELIAVFDSEVCSITDDGKVAVTVDGIYWVDTQEKLYDLGSVGRAQVVDSESGFLYYEPVVGDGIAKLDLSPIVSKSMIESEMYPRSEGVVSDAQTFSWGQVPGAVRYRLSVWSEDGLNELYAGDTVSSEFQLPEGVIDAYGRYGWRIDTITPRGLINGELYFFNYSPIEPAQLSLEFKTIDGVALYDFELPYVLDSEGVDWSVSSDEAWLELSVSETGSLGVINASIRAGALEVGDHDAVLIFQHDEQEVCRVDLRFALYPNIPQLLVSDENSPRVYYISQPLPSGSLYDYALAADEPAFLVELNCITQEIERVLEVGSKVTDFALHHENDAIYVVNWKAGELLEIDWSSYTLRNTFIFSAADGSSYDNGDIFRVSAGPAGRVVLEERSQHVDITLFDTDEGVSLGSLRHYAGGGGSGQDGGLYYHASGGVSDSNIAKYDVSGDTIVKLGFSPVSGAYNSFARTFVMSADGTRLFWSGNVFDDQLEQLWVTDEFVLGVTPDGRYAFSENEIYDVSLHETIGDIAVPADMLVYNASTQTLVTLSNRELYYAQFISDTSYRPEHGEIAQSVDRLSWLAEPSALAYELYIGDGDISDDDHASASYVGALDGPEYDLPSEMSHGQYYWRVDIVTPWGRIKGAVRTFTLSPVVPSLRSVVARTVLGHRDYRVELELDADPAMLWQLAADVPWVTSSIVTGVGHSTIELILDSRELSAGTRSATLNVLGAGSVLVDIPIQLELDPLNLSYVATNRSNGLVYGVSQDPLGDDSYLLLIDTVNESIEGAVWIDHRLADLDYHPGEDKVYVLSSVDSRLYEYSPDDLSLLRTIETDRIRNIYGNEISISLMYPGTVGRLLFYYNGYYHLYDLDDGVVLDQLSGYSSFGAVSPDGRHFYTGGTGSGLSFLRRYDVSEDVFTSVGYYGYTESWDEPASPVVVSSGGSFVFWRKYALNAELTDNWSIGDQIYESADDGKYALGNEYIYDTEVGDVVLAAPDNSSVSVFNPITRKLVAQSGAQLGYFEIPEPLSLTAPECEIGVVYPDGVQLLWRDRSLEINFELEYRLSVQGDWSTVDHIPAANSLSTIVAGLELDTEYEFRCRARANENVSAWSEIVSSHTASASVASPVLEELDFSFVFYRPSVVIPGVYLTTVYMNWSAVDGATNYQVERSVDGGSWQIVEVLSADELSYTKGQLPLKTTYTYRVRAINGNAFSEVSVSREFNFSARQVVSTIPPDFMAETLSREAIRLTWGGGLYESNYVVNRRVSGDSYWEVVATTPANVTEFIDTELVAGTRYEYRVVPSGGEYYSTYIARSIARDLGVQVDGDILTVDCILWSEAGSSGVLSMEVKTNRNTRSDSSSVDYTSRFDVRFRYDVSSQEFLDFTFLDGVILHSDLSMEVIDSKIKYNALGQRLDTALTWGTSGLVQQIETIHESGTISTDGDLARDAHQVDAVDGRLSISLSPEGYEPVMDATYFDQNPESELFTGDARLVIESVSASDALGATYKVVLTMAESESSVEDIEETDATIKLSEESVIVASTEIFVPSDFSQWAASSGVELHSPNQRNEAGMAYSLLYAFQQPVNSYNIPIELSIDTSVALYLALPEDGVRGTILPYYSETLAPDSWQPLPAEYYIDGINSLNLGQSGRVGLEFPQADQCFIRFEAQLP